jgi:hypothetical protein
MASAIRAAANEGQGVYRLADEMGVEGRNLLATTTNAPGRARETVADFLTGRNIDAPRRLQGALQEASGTTQTAAQMQAAMKAARDAQANASYGAAREQAGAVDVSGALAQADEVLRPGVTGMMRPQTDIADNTIESVTRRARGLLSDGNSQVSDFSAALLAKQNIDDMIRTAQPNQQRVLIGIRNQLDEALSSASQPYAAARDQFRTQSQAMEAIDEGAKAAKAGRHENTIPSFLAMRPDQQAGFRGGYFDDLITKLQQITPGPTNDASRGLRSTSLNAEIPTFAAPSVGEKTARQIAREADMAKTNARALGGSRTSENMIC